MKHSASPRMMDYLLGRLAPADRESIREEIFASEEAWNELAVAEEELIDSYARDELDAEQRALVEERLLWSEAGQRKLRTARALLQAGEGSRRRWIGAIVGVAAAIVLLLIGSSVWWKTRTPQGRASTPPVVATLTIPLAAQRGESAVPQVNLPPSGARLRVELRLGASEPASGGTARFVFRDVERSYPISINGDLAVIELDRGDLHEGPCQIEVTAAGRLVAASSVVFTQ